MAYKDEVYWIERDKIGIATLDRTATSITNEFTGPPGSKTVTLFIVSTDEQFHESTTSTGYIGPLESPNIPTEFHEALTYKVLERLYAKNPQTIQVAQYWDVKWQRAIIEGKKYANTGRDGAAPKIKPAEY